MRINHHPVQQMRPHSPFLAVLSFTLAITSSGRLSSEEKGGCLVIDRPQKVEESEEAHTEGWEEIEGGFFRKSFRVFSGYTGSTFQDPPPDRPNRKTAQDILRDAGIQFADGTSANFAISTGVLSVVQTKDQIPAVESYIESIIPGREKHIHIRAEIYEVSQAQGIQVIESAQSEGEHTPERDALMKAVKSGGVKLIAFPNIICRSGQRALILEELVSEEAEIPTENEAEIKEEPAESTPITISKLEADAVLGADEFTIDLNFSLSISELLEQEEAGTNDPGRFRQRTITTQATLLNGNHQLIGSWSAAGDRVYLVFLSAHLQEVEPVRKAPAKSE